MMYRLTMREDERNGIRSARSFMHEMHPERPMLFTPCAHDRCVLRKMGVDVILDMSPIERRPPVFDKISSDLERQPCSQWASLSTKQRKQCLPFQECRKTIPALAATRAQWEIASAPAASSSHPRRYLAHGSRTSQCSTWASAVKVADPSKASAATSRRPYSEMMMKRRHSSTDQHESSYSATLLESYKHINGLFERARQTHPAA